MTFEPAPNSPERKPINPFLKFVLELGPLGVFFFANWRGDTLAAIFPALAALGGPLFVATALCIVATVIALVTSLILTRRLPIMPFVTGIVVRTLAAHPRYRHRPESKRAAALLASRFFQADPYPDRHNARYWTKSRRPSRTGRPTWRQQADCLCSQLEWTISRAEPRW